MLQNSGNVGEKLAAKYLAGNHYKVIGRNYKIRNGEIDIIAIDTKENALVFVEVKTRTSDKFGTPLEAIHYFKLKALINAAQVYKNANRNLPDQMRIDAIAIYVERDGILKSIEHVKNISM